MVWWWLRPILVVSLSLDQAEQLIRHQQTLDYGHILHQIKEEYVLRPGVFDITVICHVLAICMKEIIRLMMAEMR